MLCMFKPVQAACIFRFAHLHTALEMNSSTFTAVGQLSGRGTRSLPFHTNLLVMFLHADFSFMHNGHRVGVT